MNDTIYGGFSEAGDEYVVTRHDTPMPWVNYLSNGDYCAIVSSTGGGFSFHKSHHANMVLRREQRSLLTDRPGRYVYVRDRDSGEWWTVNVMPVKRPHRKALTTVASGSTKVASTSVTAGGTFSVSRDRLPAGIRTNSAMPPGSSRDSRQWRQWTARPARHSSHSPQAAW